MQSMQGGTSSVRCAADCYRQPFDTVSGAGDCSLLAEDFPPVPDALLEAHPGARCHDLLRPTSQAVDNFLFRGQDFGLFAHVPAATSSTCFAPAVPSSSALFTPFAPHSGVIATPDDSTGISRGRLFQFGEASTCDNSFYETYPQAADPQFSTFPGLADSVTHFSDVATAGIAPQPLPALFLPLSSDNGAFPNSQYYSSNQVPDFIG